MLRVTAEQKLAIKRTARKLGLTITEFTLLSLMKAISDSETNQNSEVTLDLLNSKDG
ncbi:antitoxin [Clostridium hominis]|nr:antitoxin [Clostridium hominis]